LKYRVRKRVDMSATILVVDDEPGVRDMLCDALSIAGYNPVSAKDGFAAHLLLRDIKVDLIITDINMPNMDGYELLERLRAMGNNTPAILLTARGERADVTRGLKLGADDYVTKPFGLEELTLRVAAILRRTRASKLTEPDVLAVGPVELDADAHSVKVGGKAIDLSPTEFKLLHELMKRPGKVVTKNQLLDVVWGMGYANNSSVVDTYISYLRKKIHIDGFEGVKTVRGIGFQIVGAG
jgi:two-component system OmpR family response regulator